MAEKSDTLTQGRQAVRRRVRRASQAVRRQATAESDEYAGAQDRPLAGYAALLGAYGLTGAGLAAVAWSKRRELPRRLDAGDLALLSVATFKLSRVLARDSVTSPLRAPFARFSGAADGPAEVDEEVRGSGPRKVLGELVTCPFCLGQWVATALMGGHLLAPRATRVAAATLAMTAAADALHLGYSSATRAAS